MAKRKTGVQDIIYELNNEDVEISSEDEVRESKISRLELNVTPSSLRRDDIMEESCTDMINVKNSSDEINKTESISKIQNGGKTMERLKEGLDCGEPIIVKGPVPVESDSKKTVDNAKTTILNEDIVVDSPSSNNYVNDFANRTPLLTVRFRDNKLASNYKEKIKAFMLKLIKIHDEENSNNSENETDLELDIWPEDFSEEINTNQEIVEDNLFFVDTDPNIESYDEIPSYSQASTLITNSPQRDTTPPPTGWKIQCFNCDGQHSLRDCPLPRNSAKIAEKRKQVQKVGRYHIEDEQKYGNLIPGRISGQLRHALGLKRHEIPMYIYRMRQLGYPPGWLEEAKISHSGITMFDSTGTAIQDPEEEEGELCEPGSKDKFDIKKLLDFPGFNVPVSSRYKEEAHLFGLPPMSDQDSKLAMLQSLAPNAMKAYKRKKLAFFPSVTTKSFQDSPAEMDLDSGDEQAVFPSVPPLPDEAPPPLPPPPPESPPPSLPSDTTPASKSTPPDPPSNSSKPPLDTPIPPSNIPSETDIVSNNSQCSVNTQGKVDSIKEKTNDDDDDLEVIKVTQVKDIPMPINDLITIDDDIEKSKSASCPGSPSLDDLESKKRLLLDALKGDNKESPNKLSDEENNDNASDNIKDNDATMRVENDSDLLKTKLDETNDKVNIKENNSENVSLSNEDIDTSGNKYITPGGVKGTEYGTPVINTASPYSKLPSDDKFAKDISEIITFENLPNSVGKYKKISTLLKKVKNEVDRIQES